MPLASGRIGLARAHTKVISMSEEKTVVMPAKSFKSGALQLAIWKNTNKRADGGEFDTYSFDLVRNYLDKDEKWQKTTKLRVADVPKARMLYRKGYDFVCLKDEE